MGDQDQMANELEALRRMIQSNPQMLESLLAHMAQNNPELLAQLGNRENLMRFLQDPQVLARILSGMQGQGGGPAPGQNVIQVTEEENDAIERLEALGFPKHKAVEAYFACDKNEELAANYLFDHGYDDNGMEEE